jgi:hypothetical protein
MVPFFAPFSSSPITQTELLDPPAFRQKFLTNNGGAFVNAVVSEAQHEGSANTCEALKMYGLVM